MRKIKYKIVFTFITALILLAGCAENEKNEIKSETVAEDEAKETATPKGYKTPVNDAVQVDIIKDGTLLATVEHVFTYEGEVFPLEVWNLSENKYDFYNDGSNYIVRNYIGSDVDNVTVLEKIYG